MAHTGHQSDAMIARLEQEVEERSTFIEGAIGAAQDGERDITKAETEMISAAKQRVDDLRSQLDMLYDSRESTTSARAKIRETYSEMGRLRTQVDQGAVEYRSAGAYVLEMYNASLGNRDAKERLETFYRTAAHQKTSDNLGVIPDPVIGNVLNFIDAARPLVSFIGTQDMPSATFYRPKVTQQPNVAVQGSAGAAADEKTELVSQKMTISRLTATAVTYGGYVNVSRQNIDFSSPQILDLIIDGLAAEYAVETEAALGAALIATTSEVELAGTAATDLTTALWTAAAAVYAAVKGQGRIALAVSPTKLAAWGALFAPVNPSNAQSTGFTAAAFGQGVMGYIAGIPVIMSAGIGGANTDYGVLFSTAAIEAWEQRVGSLQAVEPSVLGVQVAYAGYFTPLTVAAAGVQRIVNEA